MLAGKKMTFLHQVNIITCGMVLLTQYSIVEITFIRMTLVQGDSGGLRLGWVDLDLGSSPGWWAATVATYCPSRMVEHPKSKSTQPRS